MPRVIKSFKRISTSGLKHDINKCSATPISQKGVNIQRHRQTDRRTDGRTAYHSITALCGASRGNESICLCLLPQFYLQYYAEYEARLNCTDTSNSACRCYWGRQAHCICTSQHEQQSFESIENKPQSSTHNTRVHCLLQWLVTASAINSSITDLIANQD